MSKYKIVLERSKENEQDLVGDIILNELNRQVNQLNDLCRTLEIVPTMKLETELKINKFIDSLKEYDIIVSIELEKDVIVPLMENNISDNSLLIEEQKELITDNASEKSLIDNTEVQDLVVNEKENKEVSLDESKRLDIIDPTTEQSLINKVINFLF